MNFRSLVLKPFDPTWKPLPQLPDAPQLSPQEAALWIQPFLENDTHFATKPRVSVEDAIRLVHTLREHFAQDWPALLELTSRQEAWRSLQAYLFLPTLLHIWRTLQSSSSSPQSSPTQPPKEQLAHGTLLRDRLLSLASVAYQNDPDALREIQRIRANDPKTKDRYDEIAKDLSDTVQLFQSKTFLSQHNVSFPEEMLNEAWELAFSLPIHAPKKRKSKAKPKPELPLHTIFGIFSAAYLQLHTNGHFLDPSDKDKRYPKLAHIKNATPSPQQPASPPKDPSSF